MQRRRSFPQRRETQNTTLQAGARGAVRAAAPCVCFASVFPSGMTARDVTGGSNEARVSLATKKPGRASSSEATNVQAGNLHHHDRPGPCVEGHPHCCEVPMWLTANRAGAPSLHCASAWDITPAGRDACVAPSLFASARPLPSNKPARSGTYRAARGLRKVLISLKSGRGVNADGNGAGTGLCHFTHAEPGAPPSPGPQDRVRSRERPAGRRQHAAARLHPYAAGLRGRRPQPRRPRRNRDGRSRGRLRQIPGPELHRDPRRIQNDLPRRDGQRCRSTCPR